MQKMDIRQACCGDERFLAHIQAQSWASAFASILPAETMQRMTNEARLEEMYRHVLAEEGTHLLLQYADDEPCCIAGWSKERGGQQEKTAELICIHCVPGQRSKGYGGAMIERVLGEMKAAGFDDAVLWVFTENHAARRFYEKHGFTQSELRKDSFGAEEILYRRML